VETVRHYGHAGGHRLIGTCAALLKQQVGRTDVAARIAATSSLTSGSRTSLIRGPLHQHPSDNARSLASRWQPASLHAAQPSLKRPSRFGLTMLGMLVRGLPKTSLVSSPNALGHVAVDDPDAARAELYSSLIGAV
jgi:hypothetical protein